MGTDQALGEAETRRAPASSRDVPQKLPPLRRAAAVQRKAAGVGFDWPDHAGILDKLHEEIGELAAEMRRGSRARIKDEVGDILFTVVNLARYLKVDPESVLEGTTTKFIERFDEVERRAQPQRQEALLHEPRRDGTPLAEEQSAEADARRAKALLGIERAIPPRAPETRIQKGGDESPPSRVRRRLERI